MQFWFTADHHFGHKNIIKYTNRPFSSLEEMDNELIKRWNSVIDETDVVYHLGDFTLLSYKDAYKYLDKLNGTINLVPGGHDKRWIRHVSHFENVNLLPTLDTYYFNEPPFPFVLCHYPMLSWDRSHYGSVHLHGHSHGVLENTGYNRIDVGVDTNNFYPYSLDEILEKLNYDE